MRLLAENVSEWLREELGTGEVIRLQKPLAKETGNYILIQQQSGFNRRWPDSRQDVAIQLLFYFADEFTAREKAFLVFDKLREEEHGRVFPASTSATGSQAVQTTRIDVPSQPFYLGMEDRWNVYSLNFIATYFP